MEFIINFQNSILYEFIRQCLALLFYILLAIYIFCKIYNIIFIKKINCKDEYKEKKKEILNKTKETIHRKIINKIAKFLLIFLILCVVIFAGILFVNIVILIFTFFGISLEFSNSPIIMFVKNFMNVSSIFLIYIPVIIFYLIPFLFYGLIYSLLIKGIYVNINIKKFLNEKAEYHK